MANFFSDGLWSIKGGKRETVISPEEFLLVFKYSSPSAHNMVLKLSVAIVALAALASAANYKRVACPDGVNTATNAAVSAYDISWLRLVSYCFLY